MAGTQLGGSMGDLPSSCLDGRRQRFQEFLDCRAACLTPPQGCDEDFCVCRGWHHEAIAATAGGRERLARRVVMSILRVQDCDQHPGVEDG